MTKLLEMLSKTDLRGFSGNWVAVKDRHVISSNQDIKVVLETTKEEPVDEVIIMKVPKKDQIMIL
jgi:hypothetical protein